MYEELEFGYMETKLMEWDDEVSRGWAFEEFLRKVNGYHRGYEGYPNFAPQSMADLRYINVAGRQRAMEFCLNMARSERFSEERKARLRDLKDFLKEGVDLQGYRRFKQIITLAESGLAEQDLADCCDAQIAKRLSDEIILEKVEVVREAAIKELRMRVGYLNLVYRLLQLGDDGDPDELIPSVAFYFAWPEAGTPVIAWDDKNPEKKVVGCMAPDRSIDFYEAAVDPLEASFGLIDLDIPLATERIWVNSVLPIELVEFYSEQPELFREHRRVLNIGELDYLAELLQIG